MDLRSLARPCLLTLCCAVIFPIPFGHCSAQHRSHPMVPAPDATGPCFDAADRSETRLWDGRAPGAAGDDPCRDIPFVKFYPAANPEARAMPTLLILPGGGYDRLTDTKEQAPVAEYFAQTLHVNAFVVTYRLAQKDGTYRYPVPMWDGQRALKLVRAHAKNFNVDPSKIGLFGFSAGGHLATMLAEHSASDFGLPVHDAVDDYSGRPDLLGLGYPVISMDPAVVPATGSYKNLLHGYDGPELRKLQTYLSGEKAIAAHTPPVFLFESMDDARISPQNSVLFADALRAAHIAVEAHLFQHGEHGAGLAAGLPEESAWPALFQQWLRKQGF